MVMVNEVEITNPKDAYLPRHKTNKNMCALFSAGRHSMLDFQL